jgi:Rrf2 family iron-sulfur cluster assembly transcriptional regulator
MPCPARAERGFMLSLSLSNTAEYALRAMTMLALDAQESAINARDLAGKTRVPVHYLNKIMNRLVEAGLVTSAKGHGGGFRLGKPASRISYLDILKVMGYNFESRQCVFGWEACRSDRPCPMHDSWSRANDSFVAWARSTSLASLRRQPTASVPSLP